MKSDIVRKATASSNGHHTVVRINATRIHEVEPGLFALEIPSEPLQPHQLEVLMDLYPDLNEKAFQLLDRQIVLNAIERVKR